VTEQVAILVVPVNVQGDVTKLPVPELVQATVPVGVVAPVVEVSLTVAVHVVAWLMKTDDGVHDSVVLVGCNPPTLIEAAP